MTFATHQYLTFRLDQEIYALDVGNAREIVATPRLTRLPNAPNWIRGVMNLRGAVVPVIDLKQKFEMGETNITRDSCAVLVEFLLEDEPFVIGVLVDAVLAVFEMLPQDIEPPPRFGARYSREYLRGVGRRDDHVFVILEADKVFSDTRPALESSSEATSDATFARGSTEQERPEDAVVQ